MEHSLETFLIWKHDYELGNQNELRNITINIETALLTRLLYYQLGNIKIIMMFPSSFRCFQPNSPVSKLYFTLYPQNSALADDPHPDCECENNFKDISQNGFTIFATWMCKHCGCGCVRVQWCQKKITAFDCNCNQEYTFFCVHVKVSL